MFDGWSKFLDSITFTNRPILWNHFRTCWIVRILSLNSDIFGPLFEVTKNPKSHPKLHIFLQRVIGFDSVDDESKPEKRAYKTYPPPMKWTSQYNPPYSYYIYYLFANMSTLNFFRKARGFSIFNDLLKFRYVCSQTARRRSRRYRSSNCCISNFSLNFARNPSEKSSCFAVLVLSRTNWCGNVPTF